MELDEAREIARNVFINMPFSDIEKNIHLIDEYRLNLEIGVDHISIDEISSDIFKETAERLKDLGISMTVHAPYNEIFLGAPDSMIREASILRMDSAFKLIPYFSPISVVIHLNYENRRFGFIYDEWLSRVIPLLRRYADKCGEMGSIMTIENVYEETPDVMAEVLDALDGYPVYHCFDVGHLNAFSNTGMREWIDRMGMFIAQFHLHDNNGLEDSHSSIGSGSVDFSIIRDFISGMEKRPVITLEPHSEKDLWKTLRGFKESGLYEALNRFEDRNEI